LQHILYATGIGNVDHHAFHLLLLILIVGTALLARPRWSTRSGVLLGLLCGLAMWSGSAEFIVLLVPVAILAVVDVVKADGPKPAAFWRVWWMTATLATAAALAWEFWPEPFHSNLEFLSIWHVAVWLVGGISLELLGRFKPRWYVCLGGMVAAAGLLVLIAGAIKGFDFARLHILQDARARRIMAFTEELQPVGDKALMGAWQAHGLLLLGLAFAAWSLRQMPRGERFLVLATLFVGEMALWQARWTGFFVALLVLTTAVGLRYLVGRARWLIPVAMVLATIGPWTLAWRSFQTAKASHWDPGLGPYGRQLAADEIAQNLLAEGRRPVVLAPTELSMYLVGTGNVRVIGSAFWSNTDGLYDHYEFYTTTDDRRFSQLLRERGVNVVVFNGIEGVRYSIQLAYAILHNRAIGQEETEQTSLARFLRAALQGNQMRHFATPRLQQLTGDWRLVLVPTELMRPRSAGAPDQPGPVPVEPSPALPTPTSP
jgi:hypothetical protein